MLPDAPPIAQYAQLLEEKVARTVALLAPLSPPAPTICPSPAEGFRMRAEFRIWHEGDDSFYAMFDPKSPRDPIRVDRFPIASRAIQDLMPTLLDWIRTVPELRHRLFQAEFLSTSAGDTLITLAYHRPLDDAWKKQAQRLAQALDISVIGRSRKRKTVIGRDYVTETLTVHGSPYHYRQYEQGFTQPNAAVNAAMLEWATDSVVGLGGDLLELYCGNGNFTLPLSCQFGTVIATELSKQSTQAAQHNLLTNGIRNTHIIRLAAEEVAQALTGVREFRRLQVLPQSLDHYQLDTVFVDPPRAGLDPATLDMVGRFNTILYISCNPHTLLDNLLELSGRYRIMRFGLFDQFPYTDHMECGVLLTQR